MRAAAAAAAGNLLAAFSRPLVTAEEARARVQVRLEAASRRMRGACMPAARVPASAAGCRRQRCPDTLHCTAAAFPPLRRCRSGWPTGSCCPGRRGLTWPRCTASAWSPRRRQRRAPSACRRRSRSTSRWVCGAGRGQWARLHAALCTCGSRRHALTLPARRRPAGSGETGAAEEPAGGDAEAAGRQGRGGTPGVGRAVRLGCAGTAAGGPGGGRARGAGGGGKGGGERGPGEPGEGRAEPIERQRGRGALALRQEASPQLLAGASLTGAPPRRRLLPLMRRRRRWLPCATRCACRPPTFGTACSGRRGSAARAR